MVSTARVVAIGLFGLLIMSGCAGPEVQEGSPDNWGPSVHAPGKMGALQDCLEAAGWEVQYSRGILIGPSLPAEQSALYEADNAQCAAEAHFYDPLTAEDYHRLYPLEVATHRCLLAHGYDSADPPSEQQFVDDWLAQSPDREPYQAIASVFLWGSNDDFRAATQSCPLPLWGF